MLKTVQVDNIHYIIFSITYEDANVLYGMSWNKCQLHSQKLALLTAERLA